MSTTISQFRGQHAFLSNFHPVPGGVTVVDAEGGVYRAPTVEHLFQAFKTYDQRRAHEVLNASTPREAKRLGRRLPLREDWDEVRDAVMRLCLSAKFSEEQHPELAQALLDTGDAELVEGNTWGDWYWGVDLSTGDGINRLGKLLVEQRARLREGRGLSSPAASPGPGSRRQVLVEVQELCDAMALLQLDPGHCPSIAGTSAGPQTRISYNGPSPTLFAFAVATAAAETEGAGADYYFIAKLLAALGEPSRESLSYHWDTALLIINA